MAGSCLLSSAIRTEIAGAEIKLSRMGEWVGMGVGWSAGNKFNSSPREVGLELRFVSYIRGISTCLHKLQLEAVWVTLKVYPLISNFKSNISLQGTVTALKVSLTFQTIHDF